MNQERLMKVLLTPHVTEKTAMAGEGGNMVAFKVIKDASKQEIKGAVELLFEVEVDSVRTVKIKGKNKRFGSVMGRRGDLKKAYVTLKPGQNIEMLGTE